MCTDEFDEAKLKNCPAGSQSDDPCDRKGAIGACTLDAQLQWYYAGGDVTTAQHCRAEVWADGYGWIPVDPADVRKLMLEEQKPSLSDPSVAKAREALFGSWEMNWIAFNDAHDVALPGSAGTPLPFLMYPQAEVGGVRLDSLDPATFKYTITARQL